jgi:hypothetical protein
LIETASGKGKQRFEFSRRWRFGVGLELWAAVGLIATASGKGKQRFEFGSRWRFGVGLEVWAWSILALFLGGIFKMSSVRELGGGRGMAPAHGELLELGVFRFVRKSGFVGTTT